VNAKKKEQNAKSAKEKNAKEKNAKDAKRASSLYYGMARLGRTR
jgi:hypothetical protein